MSKETTDIKIEKLGMEVKPFDKVLAKVAELCPAAVQNGKVDFERLKAELADVVDENARETYEFKWVGKNAAMVEANKPIRKTLRSCKEESKNWDTTENLYIEGDNLEVLKLLEEGYLGKIKMIYIDPPYNTGNDFVYHDNRVQSEEEMNQGIDLFDEEDNRLLSKSFVRNTESSGRFHSDWCSMMYPRLKLARDLLTDDGVIFISIDDNEVANLKKICDEVFGEDNFVVEMIWQKKTGASDAINIAKITEYILVYAKKMEQLNLKQNTEAYDKKRYRYNDEYIEQRGPFYYDSLDRGTLGYHESLDYAITAPDGTDVFPNGRNKKLNDGWRWKWGKEKVKWGIENGFIEVRKNDTKNGGWGVYYKIYENVDNDGNVIHRSSPYKNLLQNVLNTHASTEAKELFGRTDYFSNPKPVELIKHFILLASENDDIVLDFFSGSATTAHAIMQLNAEDGGNRKFIMVQLPEETDEKSEAYKAGYKNICEIGKERIRRAGDKIMKETGKTDLDIGFRVLKVDDSNMQDVYYKPSELKQADLLSSIDNIKADRTPLDLLFGVMVEWGVSLSLPLQEVKVGENTIHIVGDNDLVACFDKNVSTATITKMAELNPTRVVFRDSCFEKDDEKINMFEIFKTICHWDDKQAKDNVRVM